MIIFKASKSMTNYRSTLNMPETAFPMRANLAKREPLWLEEWTKKDLYQKIRFLANQQKRPRFILHDGPPYANGNIHIGHAVNKVLKDMIIRSKTLSGYDAPYVPGWDCHGLPIEHQIEKEHGRGLEPQKVRALCRQYAQTQVEHQRKHFIRMGILGQWDAPYTTMKFETEAAEIRALGKLYDKGFLTRGLKPVNWCFDCSSALAEAEVEYADRKTVAIDVAFEVMSNQVGKLAKAFNVKEHLLSDKPVAFAIWTTTPWTLPVNQALMVHPEVQYALIKTSRFYLILATNVYQAMLEKISELDEAVVLGQQAGQHLVGLEYQHPFAQRVSAVLSAEFVDSESGTGVVHCSPAHGIDDFYTFLSAGHHVDDVLRHLGPDGRFSSDAALVGGLSLSEASKFVVKVLQDSGHLLFENSIVHSTMHCWRHKTPLIYRATTQWFVKMDDKTALRDIALDQIEKTEFHPSWGKARLSSMIANRPDWCISRQRNWGVPIPFLIHKKTGELHPDASLILNKIADIVSQKGLEAYFQLTTTDLLDAHEASDYEMVQDILDVWFDSGVTHWSVLRGSHQSQLSYPADLYLEGSDQHRGWFHSSLLTGCMLDGQAPYRSLLTHGFVVDEQGHKLSKSRGNGIDPQEVMNTMGADILRLWVASSDYSGELSISKEILNRVVEIYRRLRNSIRFLLSNTVDFDPLKDALPVDEWCEIDRYAVVVTKKLQADVCQLYENYEFHKMVRLLQNYCSEFLGGFYLDILKDRLYTYAQRSPARRSAQNALHQILHSLVRLIAPITAFTAEEVWSSMQCEDTVMSDSVMLSQWHQFPRVCANQQEEDILVDRWESIQTVKAHVAKDLEILREKGDIGLSLQAEITIQVAEPVYGHLASLKEELRFVLMCSKVMLEKNNEGADLMIQACASDGQKCTRCWHWCDDLGQDKAHPELCGRCTQNVQGVLQRKQFA